MKQIAIITDQFPPEIGAGKNRILGLTKFLSYNKIKVHILTIPIIRKNSNDNHDEMLMNNNIKVYRKGFIFGYRRGPLFKIIRIIKYIMTEYILPDKDIDWFLSSYKSYERYITKHNIEIIFTSSTSFSTILFGLKLKSKLSAIKWILDLRDPWFYNENKKYKLIPRIAIKKIEQLAFKYADCVTVVTDSMKKLYSTHYPDSNIAVIKNGFNPNINYSEHILCKNRVIAYTGILYRMRENNIIYLAKAIRNYNETNKNKISLYFAGDLNIYTENKLKKILMDKFVYKGRVGQNTAYSIIKSADFLFLPVGQRYTIPSKFYEYISTKQPILAVVDSRNNEMIEMLDNYGNAVIFNQSEEYVLNDVFQEFSKKKVHKDFIELFNYSKITDKLIDIISSVEKYKE